MVLATARGRSGRVANFETGVHIGTQPRACCMEALRPVHWEPGATAAEADVAHCHTWPGPGAIPTALVPAGRVLCRLDISPAPGDLVCSVFIELNGAPQAVARCAQGSSSTGPGVCGPIIKLRWLFIVARVMSIKRT